MTNKLEQQADLLFANINGWEQSVLERIGKRINKIGKMSVADVQALNNIADVKGDMKEITKELARVTGMNVRQIEKIYADTLTEQHLANKPLYDYRHKVFVPFEDNIELQAIAHAYAKSTAETMVNLSKTKMLCVRNRNGHFITMQKGYYDILDRATMQVASGATDFHTAMRESIKQMGSGGMRVDYGGGITRRLDTVVRQNLLWGAKQASIAYNEMIGEELGCDGIEIDYHSNPRPSHAFMQGKQYVLGKARKCNGIYFESADEALERLEDYNCYHYKTPIICGISEPRYSDKELAELKARDERTFDIDGHEMSGYQASQAMRRLETAVREQKSMKAMYQASGDKLAVRECNERIKRYKDKYAEISDITGIAQDKKRMTLTGADKIKGTSAPKEPKSTVNKPQKSVENVDNSAKSGIIKNEKNYKRFSLNEEKTYEQWKDNYYAKNTPKITKQDKAALKEYTDGSYDAINGVERYEKGSEAYKKICRQYGVDNLDKYKKVSDAISSAVSKFDLDEDIITHRYVSKADYITMAGSTAKDLKNAIGNEFTDKGFTSTCIFEHLTEKFGGKDPIHLEIKVPKGTNGAYINEFSEKKNMEFEFLLNRGTNFKVLDGGERNVTVSRWITSERAWKDVKETEKYMILEVLK